MIVLALAGVWWWWPTSGNRRHASRKPPRPGAVTGTLCGHGMVMREDSTAEPGYSPDSVLERCALCERGVAVLARGGRKFYQRKGTT